MYISDRDIGAIHDWARRHPEITKVWLYGSRARGDFACASDIDLAIETAGVTISDRQVRWMVAAAEWRRELRLSCEVHMEWYDPDAELEIVGAGVRNDGLLLYEAKAIS